MADFYVYDNSEANYTTIHRATCPNCRDGKGKAGSEVGPGDQFIAANTYAEARQRAKALHRREVNDCGGCKPASESQAA
jgi:hypothetical protein